MFPWPGEALEGCRGIAWLLYAMIRHRAADTWWLLVRGRGWERRGGRALRAASEMMINDVPPWPGEALEGCRGMAELGRAGKPGLLTAMEKASRDQ